MPLLFSYGTLQQEDLQLATFGRLLQGQSDELVGFEQSRVRIADTLNGHFREGRVGVRRRPLRADLFCSIARTVPNQDEALPAAVRN
jgi:hypothetical protein